MHNLIKYIILIFLFTAVSSCSTTSSGIKNPKFNERSLGKSVVIVSNVELNMAVELEKALLLQLKKQGVNVVGYTKNMEFVNNGDDINELRKQIYNDGVTEMIFLTIGNDFSNSQVVSYLTNGTANTNSNTTYDYNGATTTSITNFNGTTTPIRTFSRNMTLTAQVSTFPKGEIIWKGTSERHAQGLLFVGDGSMISNSISGVVKAMGESGMFLKMTTKNIKREPIEDLYHRIVKGVVNGGIDGSYLEIETGSKQGHLNVMLAKQQYEGEWVVVSMKGKKAVITADLITNEGRKAIATFDVIAGNPPSGSGILVMEEDGRKYPMRF